MMKAFIIALLTALLLSGCVTETKMTSPEIAGITQRTSEDYGTIVIDNRYVLYNNVWNKGAASGPYFQEVFTGVDEKGSFSGWDWKWPACSQVATYPEIQFGDSPWVGADGLVSGKTVGLTPGFPYQVGTKSMSVAFDFEVNASGKYNMSFDVWVLSKQPNISSNISHEIMIWNLNNMTSNWSWAKSLGSLETGNAVFDVYFQAKHGDASGGSKVIWDFIAFVSREPVFKGVWNIDAFLNFLIEKGRLSASNFICNLEVGNEVMGGSGFTKIREFSMSFK
jgi:hypothetical protein